MKTQRGMTLFEVLVVIVILGSIAGVVAPRLIQSLGNPLKNEVNKIATLSRQLHYAAKLRNKTYRLVIDMTPEKNAYWVESGPPKMLIDSSPTPEPKAKDSKAPPNINSFTLNGDFLKKPVQLKNPAKFEGVEIGLNQTVVREGKAYIHYFASGLGDQAAIHLSDGVSNKWTIGIQPLSGKVQMQTRDVSLKELVEQY